MASTARPISGSRRRRLELVLVLFLDEPVDVLQHHDGIVYDDTYRERQREHRSMFSVKPINQMSPNVATIEVGIAMGHHRRAEVRKEQQHHERGEDRADDQVLLDVVDGGLDEGRQVADDPRRR